MAERSVVRPKAVRVRGEVIKKSLQQKRTQYVCTEHSSACPSGAHKIDRKVSLSSLLAPSAEASFLTVLPQTPS